MISNLMFVAFGTGIFFGLLVFIVCLIAEVGLAWSVAAGLGTTHVRPKADIETQSRDV